MIGPRGFGAANFVALDREYIYRIRFENDVNATAPAQTVVVTTQLNEHIRAQSFRLVQVCTACKLYSTDSLNHLDGCNFQMHQWSNLTLK